MASSAAATELAREGVTLLLLHVPQHTVLGVDTQVFSVGPRFGGIKMVPPGPHFAHRCSPSRWSFEDGIFKRSWFINTVMITGEHQLGGGWQANAFLWQIYLEIRYSEAVKRFEFDDQLGPYNLDSFGDWKRFEFDDRCDIHCDTHGHFYAIALALQEMVSSPDDRPSARGRAVFKASLPSVLQNGTFNNYLMEDPWTQQCLQQLLAKAGSPNQFAAFRRCNDNAIVP